MRKDSVEQELLTATGQKLKGKKEVDSVYLARVATAVSDLEDPDYEALSVPAQAWFTQAAAALSEDPPAPEKIEAFPEVEEEATEEETEEVAEEETPLPEKKKPAAKVKPDKKEPVKPEPKVTAPDKGKKAKTDAVALNAGAEKAKATATPKAKSVSVADTIRYAMCEDPDITKDGVAKTLKDKKLSFDQSRLDQVYSATARVLVILRELKKLK